jgi:hypothetical protein
MIARSMTLAAQLTRTWVAMYTAGLPDELACTRRDEIESDLWEQEMSGDVSNGEALARLFFGMPADLSWRLTQRTAQGVPPSPARGMFHRGGTMLRLVKERWLVGLVGLFAAVTVLYGVRIVFVTSSGDLLGGLIFGVIPVVGAMFMVAGYLDTKRSPWKGAGLMALGAATITVIQFWMFVVYVPVALLIIISSIARARAYARGGGPVAPA